MKIHLVSLGCARNLIDSEVMLGRLKKAGCILLDEPSEAEAVIVNTCGFIRPAVDESIDTVLELAELKKNGNLKKLVVVGCLPQRYGKKLAEAIPEVDVFLGTGAFDRIVDAVSGHLDREKYLFPDPGRIRFSPEEKEGIRGLSYLSYLKIAEGCSKSCTYCIIPRLRGKQKSRSPEDIVDQAKNLIDSGVRELVLVAQDTTGYGVDLEVNTGLANLLEKLSEVVGDGWLRFLYGHPDSIDPGIVEVVSGKDNILSYYDIPIQHASEKILKRMGRRRDPDKLFQLFDSIRKNDPGAVLRTTVIVGFPGETRRDFDSLVSFVEAVRFENLGVFIYSDSPDLPSHRLSGKVDTAVARNRYDRIMSMQAQISLAHLRSRLGERLHVLIEEKAEENVFVGRTWFQAPEVDGETIVYTGAAGVGEFVPVIINDAMEYDLVAEPV